MIKKMLSWLLTYSTLFIGIPALIIWFVGIVLGMGIFSIVLMVIYYWLCSEIMDANDTYNPESVSASELTRIRELLENKQGK